MSNLLIDRLLESVLSEKGNLIKKKENLSEAVMNDIPHEIDDTVHSLAAERVRLEDLRKTWESAGFQDLTALDDIIKGLIDLTSLVYTKGAILADQKVGTIGNKLPEVTTPVVVANTVPEVKEEKIEEVIKDSEEEDQKIKVITKEEKEITLQECEDLCSQPCNAGLKRAYTKCLQDFRKNKPDCSNGEIVQIILTPRNNLKLKFDGMDKPSYAYCDGGVLV